MDAADPGAAAAMDTDDEDGGDGDGEGEGSASRRAARERRKVEDRACARLRSLVSALAVIAQTPIDSAATSSLPEALIRTLTRLFKALAEAVAAQVAPRGLKQAPPGPRFRQLVDSTYVKLANEVLGSFIQDVENKQVDQDGDGVAGAGGGRKARACDGALFCWCSRADTTRGWRLTPRSRGRMICCVHQSRRCIRC